MKHVQTAFRSLHPRLAINPARTPENYEKPTKSALDGLKMALIWLKTHEFEENPDHLPENRKNHRKWKEFALITPAQHSRAALNLLNDFPCAYVRTLLCKTPNQPKSTQL